MRATVRARSLPFAQTGRLQRFRSERANVSEPERTPNVAILATALTCALGGRPRPLLAPASRSSVYARRVGMEPARTEVHRPDNLPARTAWRRFREQLRTDTDPALSASAPRRTSVLNHAIATDTSARPSPATAPSETVTDSRPGSRFPQAVRSTSLAPGTT
jgi:hypothetical protein